MPSPINVLVVDDIAANLTAMQALLARPGLEVLTADSGSAALDLLLQHEVAVAVLDVNMPDMDGFELAELMRGSARTASIPIIFLTASAHDLQRTFRGYAAGAVDFLHKPVDGNILAVKVDVFVQLARQKQQLAEQLDTVQRLLRTNEMLMAVLAHDLRTPLSAITASALILKRIGADARVEGAADRIGRSATRMVRMVDQLLDVARLHGGRVAVTPRPTDLRRLCEAIIDEFAARSDTPPVNVEAMGDTFATVDEDLLSQVLANLVGNAIQHGEPGAPVELTLDGTDPSAISVLVRNAGAVAAEDLPNLFEAFRSGQSSRSSEGLGLGLYITRELVRLHGGSVTAQSSQTGGAGTAGVTVFTVRLPRVADPQGAVDGGTIPATHASLHGALYPAQAPAAHTSAATRPAVPESVPPAPLQRHG